ncbi:MAG: restriction endonuclease subunit S, partial [Anaerolineaceae bacterium]
MSEWKEFYLLDIAYICDEERVPLSKMEREQKKGKYPYYGASGIIDYIDNYLFDGNYILISEDGENLKTRNTPVAFKAKGQFWVNNHAHIVKGKKNFLNDLIVYTLKNIDLNPYLTGAVQPKLNQKNLISIPFLLPDDEAEQCAIANVLGSLDDKIDLLQRYNKTLEAMAETLFSQWFVEEEDEEWDDGTIADLCHTITKGTTPTTLGHNFSEKGINFIKAESMTDTGDFIWEKFAKIGFDTHNILNRSILQEGDVLCSIAGTIGRLAIVTKEILPANTNQAIAIIRANHQKCFPEFIYFFLKSPQFKAIMDGKIVHAVQPNLSLGEIGNTPIKIPSALAMNN